MSRVKLLSAAVLALAGLFISSETVRAAEPQPPKRARPPKWSADVLDAFFPDAREKLVGTRPDYEKAGAAANLASAGKSEKNSTASDSETATWSKLIDTETIETEIKRLAKGVTNTVTTPGPFKGGDYKKCRSLFSVLAVMFAIDGEYDGDVRWKDVAPGLREQFARAGYNCKVGTDQTYQEATLRKQDLADLVAGSRPQVREAERTVTNWSQVAELSPLMQRLNAAQQERLTKWVASEREFAAHANDIRHEAQIMAVIADVISREGYDFAEDEGYAGFAKELKSAATDMAGAAESGNLQQAQQASARATKACADCHEGYRG